MQATSLSLSRLETDLRMAGKAGGTIQQYLSSLRGFETFLGKDACQASQDDIRSWAEHLQRQPIGPARLRCHYSALTFLFRKTLGQPENCLLYTSPSPRDRTRSRMPSSA